MTATPNSVPLTERLLDEAKALVYKLGGRRPGASGYRSFRDLHVQRTLASPHLMAVFEASASLPQGFGRRIDERVVEYPWVVARLGAISGRLLDAGAALNHRFLLRHSSLATRSIVMYTLGPSRYEPVFVRPNVSYIYGDLRETILRDEIFDVVVCVSTIEHIGMDNTQFYTGDTRFREQRGHDYLAVVRELRRVLRPGGTLLLTVPYGRPQQLGWLQQFTVTMLDEVVEAFGGTEQERSFYRYDPRGWQRSSAEACADCEYYDMHREKALAPDMAAAARGVACLALVK